MKRTSVVVFLVVAVVVGAAVALVMEGRGGGEAGLDEERGDVSVEAGPQAPPGSELADLRSADVRADGSAIVFEAGSARDVPRGLKQGTMSWRWEIRDGDTVLWILSASLDVGPNATLFNPATDFGVNTIDGSFPGKVRRDGQSLIVRLKPREVEGFPREFEWVLTTTVDGSQGDPQSTVASDRAPDEGLAKFSED